jgi:P27 family predicted phage terminase small subunit
MPDPAVTPKPPRHLRAETRRWWAHVVNTWVLEEHHRRLLTAACEAWDRMQQARELIAREGLTTGTARGGARLHPAVRVETDARLAFCRCLRELDLDIEAPTAQTKRPPSLRSIPR